jgi:serine/threonine protein kinase
MNELYEKVKRGNYKLPLWLSKEAVSFLNGMLQYDSKRRLSSDDLLRHDFLTKNVKDFQSVDKNQLKGKINGNMMNINIKNNNTIWGIFNENHNDINDNVPLSEEEGIKNFETMPNTEGMGEKFLNNNDNKILNNNKINNNNNNNKINNNKIQSKNPNTFSNVSSFAVVNEIKNVDTTNQINHLNNNQKIIPGNNPLIQKNHQIKPNINNKNPQLLNTTFPSRQFDRQHTFDNNMNLLNQNNKKMPHNQNPLYRTNINQQNQNQNHQNKALHPLQKRYTLQNNPNQLNNIYNNFNAQQKLPNMSQMNEFCKIKSNALNEFL